jgi:hypothetical protein
MWITKIADNKLRIESNHGPTCNSPGLNRLISRLKTRGCTITRTGHSGLVLVTGTPKLTAQWQQFKLNEKFQANC